MASTKTVLAVAVLLLAVVVVECVPSAQCLLVTDFASCLPYVNLPNAKNPSRSDPCCDTMTAESLIAFATLPRTPIRSPGVNVDFKKELTLPKIRITFLLTPLATAYFYCSRGSRAQICFHLIAPIDKMSLIYINMTLSNPLIVGLTRPVDLTQEFLRIFHSS
ncbi:unnamed protein product [Calypogeia fissa]